MPSPEVSTCQTPPYSRGGVFALGNFDGVHAGHQVVVRTAIEKARGMGLPARVMTFEPHPRTLFNPGSPPFRLTPKEAKIRILKSLGVDEVLACPFTKEFSLMPAADFVQKILVEKRAAQHVVAGSDFVFGHDRGGNMQKLREWLGPHGVGVTEVTPFRDAHGMVMSSSRARELLVEGQPRLAAHILGRPWSISGTVERGAQRGREMSVPTANIPLGEYLRPKFGVYAVNAGRVGERLLEQGVANIGVRPSFGDKAEVLEFHLFNFSADIYGQEWEVELVDFIRSERAFPDLESLRQQIMQDIEIAKSKLA